MDGWNTIVSFCDGLFSGAMLVSGSVSNSEHPKIGWGFLVFLSIPMGFLRF